MALITSREGWSCEENGFISPNDIIGTFYEPGFQQETIYLSGCTNGLGGETGEEPYFPYIDEDDNVTYYGDGIGVIAHFSNGAFGFIYLSTYYDPRLFVNWSDDRNYIINGQYCHSADEMGGSGTAWFDYLIADAQDLNDMHGERSVEYHTWNGEHFSVPSLTVDGYTFYMFGVTFYELPAAATISTTLPEITVNFPMYLSTQNGTQWQSGGSEDLKCYWTESEELIEAILKEVNFNGLYSSSISYLDKTGTQLLISEAKRRINLKQDIFQVAELPIASESLLGKIYQYTGVATASLTHGGVYECVSDGADPATYSWVRVGFDTAPTQGSTNAVTSDGVYQRTPLARGTGARAAQLGMGSTATGADSLATGYYASASGTNAVAFGKLTQANQVNMLAIGSYNAPHYGDLFNIGNGDVNKRSNILEANSTSINVNGDIKINNVAIPTPYTTMPTITESMLGKIAMYVGATGNGYTQGCFYIAATDGAAEPTYSWVKIGGGRTETVLWENEGTTNPDTITLSEAWSNFDELVIVTDYIEGSKHYIDTHSILVNAFTIGNVIYLWYNDNQEVISYIATSPTLLTFKSKSQQTARHAYKIIGIKYGSGGGSGQYSGTYTPEGAVAVTPTTGTVTGVSANGTLPAVTYDTANEELTFTAGTLPTLDTDKSFVTGATAEFTGTQAIITVQ